MHCPFTFRACPARPGPAEFGRLAQNLQCHGASHPIRFLLATP